MSILLLACAVVADSDCEEACDLMLSDCEGMVYYADPADLCRQECASSERADDWAECVFGYVAEDSTHEECLDGASECGLSPCENGAEGMWTFEQPWTCAG